METRADAEVEYSAVAAEKHGAAVTPI